MREHQLFHTVVDQDEVRQRGALLIAVTIEDGVPITFAPPEPGPQFPGGFDVELVEHVVDGETVAVERWGDLKALLALA